MNRRDFFGRAAAVLAGTGLAVKLCPAKEAAQAIGYFLDGPCNGYSNYGGEYFCAHSQAQEDELYEAARAVIRDGHELYFEEDDYRPPKFGNDGVLIFGSHGGGTESVPLVNFCCVVLLPQTIGHPAFNQIRRKAERWP